MTLDMTHKKICYTILVSSFFVTLPIGLLIPTLPFHLLELDLTPAKVGLVYAVYSFFSFLSTPYWGRLSDSIGRRPILLLVALLTTVTYIGLFFSTKVWEIFLLRALAGLTAGWLPVAQATLTDYVPEKQVSTWLGYFGAIFGLSFMLGPAVVALFSFFDLPHAFMYALAAGSNLLACGCVLFFSVAKPQQELDSIRKFRKLGQKKRWDAWNWPNKEREAPGLPPHEAHKPSLRPKSWRLYKPMARPMARWLLCWFLLFLAFTGVESIVASWTHLVFQFRTQDLAVLLFLGGLGNILAQGVLTRKSVAYFGTTKTIQSGLVTVGLSFFILAVAPSAWWLYGGFFTLGLGLGLTTPAFQAFVAQLVPASEKGHIFGLLQSGQSLSRVGGPVWSSALFHWTDPRFIFYAALGGSVATFVLFSAGLARRFGRDRRDPPETYPTSGPEGQS